MLRSWHALACGCGHLLQDGNFMQSGGDSLRTIMICPHIQSTQPGGCLLLDAVDQHRARAGWEQEVRSAQEMHAICGCKGQWAWGEALTCECRQTGTEPA